MPAPMRRMYAVTDKGVRPSMDIETAGALPGVGRDLGRNESRDDVRKLFAQAKLFNQRAIAVGIARLQVVEQLAAPRHHPQQPASRMMVLRVILEMIGETVDARGQERDLHFGRPGVPGRALVIRDDLRLFANRYSHA